MTENDAYSRLSAQCAMGELCIHDVRKKMQRWEIADEVQQRVVERLLDERFIDENRYAHAFVRDKSRYNKWGVTKIRYMLASKGIQQEIISQALEDIDSGRAQVRLDKLMENKFRTLKEDPQCRLKLLRFGLGRGYGYEEVALVVDTLLKRKVNEEL